MAASRQSKLFIFIFMNSSYFSFLTLMFISLSQSGSIISIQEARASLHVHVV